MSCKMDNNELIIYVCLMQQFYMFYIDLNQVFTNKFNYKSNLKLLYNSKVTI